MPIDVSPSSPRPRPGARAAGALALAACVLGGAARAQPTPTPATSDAAAPARAAAPGARPAAGEPVTWRHVAPVLALRCARCHADQGLMGAPPEGLRLTSYAAALDAGDRARIVPGHPEASELVRRIRGQARPRMPFDGPPWLDADEIRLVVDWIAQGARDADGVPAPLPVGAAVRLHGTLEEGDRLDGLPLALGARTRIDKGAAPGQYVQVRGRLGTEGRVVVERLRPR